MSRTSAATHGKSLRRAPTFRNSSAKKQRLSPKAHDDALPFVFSNFAMTADGKIAFANHRFTPFTSQRDLTHMLELRATADAVLSGARTVDLTAATLGTGGVKYQRQRRRRGLRTHNLRVIVSGTCSVNPAAEIFQHNFSPLIVLTTSRAPAAARRRLEALGVEVKRCGAKAIDFRAALRWLKQKHGVQRLLCEGGGEVHDALLQAGLVAELHLTINPKIFGGRTAPTLADGIGCNHLAAASQFRLRRRRQYGAELFLVYERIACARSSRSLSRQERTAFARSRG